VQSGRNALIPGRFFFKTLSSAHKFRHEGNVLISGIDDCIRELQIRTIVNTRYQYIPLVTELVRAAQSLEEKPARY
jgi:hypothetical protein